MLPSKIIKRLKYNYYKMKLTEQQYLEKIKELEIKREEYKKLYIQPISKEITKYKKLLFLRKLRQDIKNKKLW